MKPRTSAILVACCAIVMYNNFGMSVEVASLVDLDSDESEETPNCTTTLTTIVDQNESADPSESVLRAPKPAVIGRRRGSELVKASEPRKRRIYPSHNGTIKQPKVINNIHIIVNGNDTTPGVNSCKRGVCNVSISSKPDEKGNIVTEVHLSIITSVKSDVEIDDVPVIDGLRGLSKNDDKQPVFYSINTPNPLHSHLHRENIPQIQINYQGYGEPWYQHRRISQRPRGYWGYNTGFRGYNTWPRGRPMVDDKIGPPFNKIKPSDTVKW